jgi:hypothetical protein
MSTPRIVSAQRMVYFSIAVVILLGITFTGFTAVHWLLYIPIVFLTFAGITGFCPGLVFWSRILHK